MKILLLGKNGQVGWELQRSLAPVGELIALDRHPVGSLSGDLSDLDALRATIRQVKPDVIVNAAAYTAVDKAESDIELADRVNGLATQVMAQEAATLGAWLVHYSTDYVFSGEGLTPWRETDAVSPVNHYGASKLASEMLAQEYAASSGLEVIINRCGVLAGAGQFGGSEAAPHSFSACFSSFASLRASLAGLPPSIRLHQPAALRMCSATI